jgi:hypothetical protein
VEEAITGTVLRRMKAMDAMAGEDTALLEAIAALIEGTPEAREA